MNVVGIDSSLRATGIACSRDGILGTARFRTKATSTLQELRDQLRYITSSALIYAPKPLLTVIETPIIARHGSGDVLERAWLYGLLVDQFMVRGPVVTVHPSTRALYATGNGRASKPEVVAAMRGRLPTLAIPDDNVADAVALLCMGLRWYGSPIDGEISKKQARAMKTPSWPTTEGVTA